MKRILGVVLILTIAQSLRAQSDSSFFEVGINTFRLFGVQRGLSQSAINPYMLHAEWSSGKFGVRAGVGYTFQSDNELPSTFNGNSSFRDDTTSRDIRLGLVLNRTIGNKWSLKFGADYFTNYRGREYNTVIRDVNGLLVESKISNWRKESGVGLFIFPQWHITPRISLATELNFLIAGTRSEQSTRSSDFPEFDTEVKKDGKYTALRPPTALFLLVRF